MENKEMIAILCEICGEIAVNLCFQCVMNLCDSCFKLVHDKNKNKNHNKELIEDCDPISLKCKEHPKDRISLFFNDDKGKILP